jgi:hypothetical protein
LCLVQNGCRQYLVHEKPGCIKSLSSCEVGLRMYHFGLNLYSQVPFTRGV